jgi:hypothetical protein
MDQSGFKHCLLDICLILWNLKRRENYVEYLADGRAVASQRGGPGSRLGRNVGVCGGQSGTGAGFLPTTSVSPANHRSTNLSHHHNHPGIGTIGLLVAAVPSRPNWIPPQNMPIKKKNYSGSEQSSLAFVLKKFCFLFLYFGSCCVCILMGFIPPHNNNILNNIIINWSIYWCIKFNHLLHITELMCCVTV